MKNIFCFILTFGLTFVVNAQITFETGTWEQAKAKAKKQKKMIFLDAYTTWCGPCKWLSNNVFTDKAVGEFHNAKFVNYKMDMEKGEGPEFAKKFGVDAYPTLLYFTKEGELAHRTVGAAPAPQLLAISQDATNSKKQYYTLLKQYEKGERKPDFLRNIALAAKSAQVDKSADIITEYMKILSKSDWDKPENAEFVAMAVKNFDSDAWKYMVANKSKFNEEQFQTAISQVLDVEMPKIADNKNEAGMKALQNEITKVLSEEKAGAINRSIENYYRQKTGTEDEKAAEDIKNWSKFNEQAWQIYENETDKAKLEKGLELAKKSIEIEENFYNTDTYAHLFYKLGNKVEALKWANKAIELGKATGEDLAGTQELLKKINQK
ncbi:MAG: thioredoxin [Bacteroidetes bacterium]|nr:MAG: thioredoxin [Bacteroidota bacterium]